MINRKVSVDGCMAIMATDFDYLNLLLNNSSFPWGKIMKISPILLLKIFKTTVKTSDVLLCPITCTTVVTLSGMKL